MNRKAYLYTATLRTPLSKDNTTPAIGTVFIRYEVTECTDLRNLEAALTYLVQCTVRVNIPNSTPYAAGISRSSSYDNYPAQILVKSAISQSASLTYSLIDYAPKTLNTTVSTSISDGKGANSSSSLSHTSGSSTAQTNSYGASLSGGFFGDLPVMSLGFDRSHSSTNEANQAQASGGESGSNAESNNGDSMSVKNWASYAYIDTKNTIPVWTWGQEYPWDCLQFNLAKPNDITIDGQTGILLPQYVLNRLFEMADDTNTVKFVYPPSQLSQFGVDFTMKSTWQIKLPTRVDDQIIGLDHTINYVKGSHGFDLGSNVTYVRLDDAPTTFTFPSPRLDLTLLGLDPIVSNGIKTNAVIGFIANKFIAVPNAGSPFKILSSANDLQITGTGFDAPMVTTFTNGAVRLTINFKMVDLNNGFSLFIKHWMTTTTGCTLTFVFNGDSSTTLVRYVNSMEGAGGDNNLLTINLRNKDYSSIDYHDYLVPGLNTISVTIVPESTASGQAIGYNLRALAIAEV